MVPELLPKLLHKITNQSLSYNTPFILEHNNVQEQFMNLCELFTKVCELDGNFFAKYFTYIAISTWCVKLKLQMYIFPRSLLLHVAMYIFYVVNSFYQAYTVYTLQYISSNENVQFSFKLVACGWHCWILVLYGYVVLIIVHCKN